jgi:hypothetical protein
MLNLIWKLVCLAALISILCLMSTGRVVLNDIKDSTIEIKAKIESRIVAPIKEHYVTTSDVAADAVEFEE